MATVSAITQTKVLSDKLAYLFDKHLKKIPEVHQEASPSIKLAYDGRKYSNFTRDKIYDLIQHTYSPGGTMPRQHVFVQEGSEEGVNFRFDAKRVESHESINFFERAETVSDAALININETKLNRMWRSLWHRLSYMMFSKQNESGTTGALVGDTIYCDKMYPNTRLAKGLEIKVHGNVSSDMWDGIDLAIRGNKEAHTYGGLAITAGDSDDNWFWQSIIDNASDATTDTNDDGSARTITSELIDLHIGEYNLGEGTNPYGVTSSNLMTGINKEIYAKILRKPDSSHVLDSLGISGSTEYRGTSYYEDPWMKDVHYPSNAIGGTVFEWGTDNFCMLLHEACRGGPIDLASLDPGGSRGWVWVPGSTNFQAGIFLWGNFIAIRRWLLARMNNYKY